MRLLLVRMDSESNAAGLELLFRGKMPCDIARQQETFPCPEERRQLLRIPPLPTLVSLFAEFHLQGGTGAAPITFHYRNRVARLAWNSRTLGRVREIRKELFSDTEESFLENLRAKHDEVLQLLREKTEQNRILDQVNNELLQLGNDLEELARERTIIEMSLKIADQVRNPATVIGGLARQLVKKNTLPEKIKLKVSQIMEQADKVEQIVGQFHHMADERRNLFTQENLVQLMRESLQNCHTFARRSVTPVLEAADGPVPVHASRHLLKVAILHVLRHAADATPQGGEVLIMVRPGKTGAELSIADQGKGLDEETLAELAQPAGVALTARQSGLMLVRQILAEHQAVLEAENLEPPAHGARLTMHFPLLWREQGRE